MSFDVMPQAVAMSAEKKRLLDVAQYFADRGEQRFASPRGVEHIPLAELQATPTRSGVYKALENALWETGTRVGSTVGDVMTAFGIDEKQLHTTLCFCHNGESVAAMHLATSLRQIASTKT